MSPADNPPLKRRLFTRIPFEARVVLNILSNAYECSLVDISLKGALVERPLPWEAALGDPCSIAVALAAEGTSIRMKGEVAHIEGGRLGMRCTEIDLESMTDLRSPGGTEPRGRESLAP